MIIKLLKKENLAAPSNAHDSDTGYDVIATSDPKIVGEWDGGWSCWRAIDYIEYDSNIQIEPDRCHPPSDLVGYTLVYPRSSICKYNLALCNSVALIDHGYRGNFIFRFRYLWQPKDLIMKSDGFGGALAPRGILPDPNRIYRKGDKIGQIVAAWKEPIEWRIVDKLEETKRGEGGFGSSGQ